MSFNFRFKGSLLALLAVVTYFFLSSSLFAAEGGGGGDLSLSGVLSNLTGTFKPLAKLLTGGAFLGGLGFAFASLMKFKAHKDNPTQIPVGTPIALFFIAVALLFLPTLFGAAGKSIFGGESSANISGTTTLP